MNRTTAIVTRALELQKELGAAQAWTQAKQEFSHVAPTAVKLAFKIYSRKVVKNETNCTI
jgi:hypothetical protein